MQPAQPLAEGYLQMQKTESIKKLTATKDPQASSVIALTTLPVWSTKGVRAWLGLCRSE